MSKIIRTEDELQEMLDDQLNSLEEFCEQYDRGHIRYAKHIAVILRVLFHDSRHSQSLLGLLAIKKRGKYYSTNLVSSPLSLSTHYGLILVGVKGKNTKYYPKLDEMPFALHWLSFEDWWGEIVFKDNVGQNFSREKLVRTITDQDGGAHVDNQLDEVFYNLSKNNSLDIELIVDGIKMVIKYPERAGIRQIAHEVLRTFFADYRKSLQSSVDYWLGGHEVVLGDSPSEIPNYPIPAPEDYCPCGEGLKYKDCHGLDVLGEL